MSEVRSVEELVTSAIRDAILRGDLRPGARLRQEQLAGRLGVSRIPLRDAFRRLEAEGLVTIDARRRAHVAELTSDDVREIYEIRILLEGQCVQYALAALPEDAARRLIAMSERMDRLAGRPLEGARARRAFYSELYRFSGRPRTSEIILRLRDDVHRYHLLKNIDLSRHQHDELRECIRKRDGKRAARVLKDHLSKARDDLVEVLTADWSGGAGMASRDDALPSHPQ